MASNVEYASLRFFPRAQVPTGGGGFPGYGPAPPDITALVGSAGVALTVSRSDHTHAHGVQTDPTLHAVASAGGGNGFMPQSNFAAVVDPTAADDSTAGYLVGSEWVNTASGEVFVCVDNTAAAAVWVSTSGATTMQQAYDASPLGPPLVTLSGAVGPFAIRDAAPTIGTLFSVANNGGTITYLSVSPTEQVNMGEAGNTSTGPGEVQARIEAGGVAGSGTLRIWPGSRRFTSVPGSLIQLGSTDTYTYGFAGSSFAGMNLQATLSLEASSSPLNGFLLFNNGLTVKNATGVAISFGPGQTFIAQPTIIADGAACSLSQNRDVLVQPRFQTTGGGALTVTTWDKIQLFGTVETGVTITTLRGLRVGTLTVATGTVGTQIGIEIENLALGTTIRGIRSAISGAAKRFIEHTGTSPSSFAGDINMNNAVNLVLGTIGGSVVNLRRSGAGLMQMIGSGGANNEGLTWDFQSVANKVIVTSTTGANIRFGFAVDFTTSDALGGGAAATLGTIGGSGPTAAAQATWLRIQIGGTTHWVPAWT